MRKYLILSVFFIFSFVTHAQTWKLKIEKNGIKVFIRKSDSTKLHEYKAIMRVKATPELALSHITDGEQLWTWNYKTTASKTLEKISDKEFIIWMKNDFTWPVSNRDHVSKLMVDYIDGGGYHVAITPFKSEQYPPKKRLIRVKTFKGYWLILPRGPYTEIIQQIYGDPRGKLPPWIVNTVLTEAPYHSFLNLKQLLEK